MALRRHAGAPGTQTRSRRRDPREPVSEVQRVRILAAMVHVACDRGVEAASVAYVVERAGVSRRTFYALFDDRRDCFLAAFEAALALASERARAAYESERRWVDRVRGGLLALLTFFDEEPELAKLCIVQALAGGPATLALRAETLRSLERVLAHGAADGAAEQPPALTAQGVLGGAFGMIHTELLGQDPRPLVDLINPMMSLIVLPYLGVTAARRELARRPPKSTPATTTAPVRAANARNPLEGLEMRLTYRTLKVLAVVATQPGINNRAVGERAGVPDQGQISKLLTRLQRLGLIENSSEGYLRGAPNSWRLTIRGGEVEQALRLKSTLEVS